MSRYVSTQHTKRTYENALRLLETRRRQLRPTDIPNARSSDPGKPAAETGVSYRGTPSIVGMREWLQKLGYTDSDITSLNIIHVAGTKGKGSTCAFTRSFLLQRAERTGFPKKIGLYTSPDLTCIRERIQINNEPISEDLFARYFFEIWERLGASETSVNGHEKQPRFLQLMALLAFHTFIREGTHAAIFETHHGGEYDATNVIAHPVATGVTSIGFDHILQLGPTIGNIAWHKAGIFKTGAPAFSAPQTMEVAATLRSRAAEKSVQLTLVEINPLLPQNSTNLFADVQHINCSLAIALVNAFLHRKCSTEDNQLSREDISLGIEGFRWAGRFETISTGSHKWFIDGAHNELSIGQAVKWFAQVLAGSDEDDHAVKDNPHTIIFSHLSEDRDGVELLRSLALALKTHNLQPSQMIFTTYQERKDGKVRMDKALKIPSSAIMDLPKQYCDIWKDMHPSANVRYESSIEAALEYARELGAQGVASQTLITGSLHLVGGALHLLRTTNDQQH